MVFSALPSLLSLVWIAVAAWLVVDCLRSGNSLFWIYLIVFIPPIGAIAYLLVNKLPQWEVARRWDGLFAGQRRIQELKAQIHNMDRAYHWARLGDEYRGRRNWTEAARCYREALTRDSQADDARYGLGDALLHLGQPAEALEHLEKVVSTQPDYDYGSAMMTVARAWRALDRPEKALTAYEAVLQRHTYSETTYEYAEMLWQVGRREEAARLMDQIIVDARGAMGFHRARERKWAGRARRFLVVNRTG